MMSYSNAGQLVVAAECTEQTGTLVAEPNINMAPPSFNMANVLTPQESVAILWDIENCPVPSDVRPEDVAGNIRMALRVHPVIRGAITMFSAYGDFNAFPRRVREGCQRTGVKLVDVPNGRKDAADKAILVDMFLFALDNRPPSFIMLISGDVDFAPALHILGQRGYTVILVIPSGVGVSSALSNAGRFVWDWPSVARGEGFVPSTRAPRNELAGYFMGCHVSDNADGQEEEAIVYRGISESYYNSRDFSVVSRSLSEFTSGNLLALPCYSGSSRTLSLPPGTNDAIAGSTASTDQNESTWWVQPGDIVGLKGQLVKLLELSGGCMTLTRVPAEYQKCFGRPLYMSEYGASKLIALLKRMSDVIAVDGRGPKRLAYLRNTQVDPNAASGLLSSRKDVKGKGTQEDGSSDELSDEERVVLEERNISKTSFCTQPDMTMLMASEVPIIQVEPKPPMAEAKANPNFSPANPNPPSDHMETLPDKPPLLPLDTKPPTTPMASPKTIGALSAEPMRPLPRLRANPSFTAAREEEQSHELVPGTITRARAHLLLARARARAHRVSVSASSWPRQA